MMHRVMIAVSEMRFKTADGRIKNCKIFRTNVGKRKMADGRWFDTGLPKGHPDLYGFRPDGRIFYIETKLHPRKPTKEQKAFLLMAIDNGAIAGVAYTVEEALRIVEWSDGYADVMKGAIMYG